MTKLHESTSREATKLRWIAEARRYMIRNRIEETGGAMNKPVVTLAVTILSAVACGATFLFALARQFAVVEIAASIVTGVQLYLLSSTVGDLREDGRNKNKAGSVADAESSCGFPVSFHGFVAHAAT
jgi:hypothetical protein